MLICWKEGQDEGFARTRACTAALEVQREHERETEASKGGLVRIAKNRPHLPKMLFFPLVMPDCT